MQFINHKFMVSAQRDTQLCHTHIRILFFWVKCLHKSRNEIFLLSIFFPVISVVSLFNIFNFRIPWLILFILVIVIFLKLSNDQWVKMFCTFIAKLFINRVHFIIVFLYFKHLSISLIVFLNKKMWEMKYHGITIIF